MHLYLRLNFHPMNFRSILARLIVAGALTFVAAPSARAEDAPQPKPDTQPEAKPEAKDEAAPTSNVAGIALPEAAPHARRVLDKAAVEGLSAQLKKLAARVNIPLGTPEVLAWSGEEYKRPEAKNLVAGVISALKDAGFAYLPMGEPMPAEGSTTTLFTANNDKTKQMLMGYWVEADNMLVLVWAGLEEPEADAFPGQPAPPAKPAQPVN